MKSCEGSMMSLKLLFTVLLVVVSTNVLMYGVSNKFGPVQEIRPTVLAFEQAQCPICYEAFGIETEKIIIILGCQHAFCKNCLEQCFEYQPLCCPYCNQKTAYQRAVCKLSMQGQDKILLYSDNVSSSVFKDLLSESSQLIRLFFQSFISDFQFVAEQHDDYEIHRRDNDLSSWVQNDNVHYE